MSTCSGGCRDCYRICVPGGMGIFSGPGVSSDTSVPSALAADNYTIQVIPECSGGDFFMSLCRYRQVTFSTDKSLVTICNEHRRQISKWCMYSYQSASGLQSSRPRAMLIIEEYTQTALQGYMGV